MSDFDFVTYKERDFRHHYAMEKEYASSPKSSGSSKRWVHPRRSEEQRLFKAWDREVSRLQAANLPFSEAIAYREHYRQEMLLWSRDTE